MASLASSLLLSTSPLVAHLALTFALVAIAIVAMFGDQSDAFVTDDFLSPSLQMAFLLLSVPLAITRLALRTPRVRPVGSWSNGRAASHLRAKLRRLCEIILARGHNRIATRTEHIVECGLVRRIICQNRKNKHIVVERPLQSCESKLDVLSAPYPLLSTLLQFPG